jgi:hypothetical protein
MIKLMRYQEFKVINEVFGYQTSVIHTKAKNQHIFTFDVDSNTYAAKCIYLGNNSWAYNFSIMMLRQTNIPTS